MKNRRGLSTLVGAVFFIIAASSTVAYVTYSMNVIDNFSQAVIIKESVDEARNSESFDVTNATITNNKFDLTVQNTGKLPLKITKLWVENTTDTTWIPAKYEIDQIVSPSGTVSGIGQNINLVALDTQSYEISLVSERGNTQTFSFNSVAEKPVSIHLHAAPENVANGFSATLFMTVTNNLPTDTTLLNIVPKLSSSGTATASCDSSPTPSSQPTLQRGESVIFKWSCKIEGAAPKFVTFTASIKNGFPGNDASTTVTVEDVLLALESGTSLASLGFSLPTTSDDILTIHQETSDTPSGEYRLSPTAADTNGFTVDLDLNNIEFITKNSSETITIPQGKWNASLVYLSAHLPSSIDSSVLDKGMIFHFEENTDPMPNANTGTTCDNEVNADISDGSSRPSWSNNQGVYSSGGYYFDGGDYISIDEDNQCNGLETNPNTTTGWFNADPSGNDGRQVIARAEDSLESEFYEIVYVKSGSSGTLEFNFDSTDSGSSIVSCTATNLLSGNWHHFVAVREDRDTCTLFVNGTSVDTQTNLDSSNPKLSVDNNWFVGANPVIAGQPNEYFKGYIDSIMHWNNAALDANESSTLSSTKYGIGAHTVDYTIEKVDASGGKTILDSQTNLDLRFLDPLQDLTEFTSSYNLTSSQSQTSLTNERLLFSINFVSGLEIDLRIDDATLNDPSTSYVQIPPPSDPLPSYFSYDTSDGNYEVKISNTGTIGAWLTINGLRGVFDDLDNNVAYASIPKYVNGTGPEFRISDTQDSVYILPGKFVTVEFYPPTTHPSVDGQYGTNIVPGNSYKFYLYLAGYDETGRTFFRTIDIGSAEVT
ncbi:MAG: LamG domain-containing protein [Nitrosopumilaceae archaeon]|nr:LamG domain-containing protein [Nitrosopumilaceae archaeon]NIU01993.1 LamG domain-containing protein [Nitrosopumilaceae archaeon]NIU87144.1 LamG domain-containing protein [Nitrosopumilaceae archaeon]NIV64634.1 LamG domain-containing protein [Nitrosopumilaceae archaeon]NIX62594.1 LamG domain-containing protein [Nitrosopumilaceae archaeon]